MNKKLNVNEMVQNFNVLRQKTENKTFSGKELDVYLNKYGFNRVIVRALKKLKAFECVKSGTSKLYSFKKEPLYVGKMSEALSMYRSESTKKKEKTEEEQALSILKNSGYQIRKCVGFDVKKFEKENPDLYSKYLIYEIV